MTFFRTDSLVMIVGYNFTSDTSPVLTPAREARSDNPPSALNLLLSVSGRITAVDLKDSGKSKLMRIARAVVIPTTYAMSFLEFHNAERISTMSIELSRASGVMVSSLGNLLGTHH